jgi:hypothetical protein
MPASGSGTADGAATSSSPEESTFSWTSARTSFLMTVRRWCLAGPDCPIVGRRTGLEFLLGVVLCRCNRESCSLDAIRTQGPLALRQILFSEEPLVLMILVSLGVDSSTAEIIGREGLRSCHSVARRSSKFLKVKR